MALTGLQCVEAGQVGSVLPTHQRLERVCQLRQAQSRRCGSGAPLLGGGVHDQEHVTRGHLLATLNANFGHHARHRRFEADLGLHGLEDAQGIAPRHGLARLYVQRHDHRRRSCAHLPGRVPTEAMRVHVHSQVEPRTPSRKISSA